jgi:hypothetical protein
MLNHLVDVVSPVFKCNNVDGAYLTQSVSRISDVTAEDGFITVRKKRGN